jgi:hypothetical protein
MKLAIDIVKNILLPKLEKDTNFDSNKTDATFWKSFATALLDFEKDDSVCKNAIYSLELNNPEKIISKLPKTYNSYVKDLAENNVLGNESEAINSLLKSNNQVFEEEIRFLSNLEQAITEIERERIKAELPTAYESLLEELNEKAKKEVPVIDLTKIPIAAVTGEHIPAASTIENRVIPIWLKKSAIAACLVLGLGVWFYTNQNQGNFPQNNVVTSPEKKDDGSNQNIIPDISSEALAEVVTVTKTTQVIESGLGLAPSSNKINLVENNQKIRKSSIVRAIEKYRQMLEKNFKDNKVGYGNRSKEIKMTMDRLQNELSLLNQKERFYEFDGKLLVLYVSNTAKENTIVLYGDNFYLKRDADYFKLTVAEKPQLYKKESNTEVLSTLDKIIFDYGN